MMIICWRINTQLRFICHYLPRLACVATALEMVNDQPLWSPLNLIEDCFVHSFPQKSKEEMAPDSHTCLHLPHSFRLLLLSQPSFQDTVRGLGREFTYLPIILFSEALWVLFMLHTQAKNLIGQVHQFKCNGINCHSEQPFIYQDATSTPLLAPTHMTATQPGTQGAAC